MNGRKETRVMRAKTKAAAVAALAVAAAGIAALAGSTAAAAPVTIDLCAVKGTAHLPGGVDAPIWGLVLRGTQADCSDVQDTATLPGTPLTVGVGDAVTITVTNALPAGHTIRFEIPGISFNPGPNDVAVGATLTVSFTASAPGTYLYQSSGDAGRQLAMGLSGALIVRPATAGQAYASPTTAYDVEAPLVLSELDPAFNADPDGFDLHDYHATYWLINGKAYPDTSPISAPAGQRVLLRYLNAGYDNTSMLLLGMHERVVARDAQLLGNPFSANTEIIPAGATEDAIATVPPGAPPSTHGFPLVNRQLHVVNGSFGDPGYSPGGMLTFIQP
jgi:FtsP/CotA-like multicopper oxidase with cupredoxin domain